MARKRNGLERDLLGVAGFGVGLGVGSAIAAKAGAPAGVQSAFGTAAGFIGPIAGLVVAKHAFKEFKKQRKNFVR